MTTQWYEDLVLCTVSVVDENFHFHYCSKKSNLDELKTEHFVKPDETFVSRLLFFLCVCLKTRQRQSHDGSPMFRGSWTLLDFFFSVSKSFFNKGWIHITWKPVLILQFVTAHTYITNSSIFFWIIMQPWIATPTSMEPTVCFSDFSFPGRHST